MSIRLTLIFFSIVLITCMVFPEICSWIFSTIEKTIKEIRYDDTLGG